MDYLQLWPLCHNLLDSPDVAGLLPTFVLAEIQQACILILQIIFLNFIMIQVYETYDVCVHIYKQSIILLNEVSLTSVLNYT